MVTKNSPNGVSVGGSCVADNICYIQGSFLCILGSFLKVNVQNGGYFLGGLLKFKILFLGAKKSYFFSFFFGGGRGGGERKVLDPSLRMKKNESISPLWPKVGVLDRRCQLALRKS